MRRRNSRNHIPKTNNIKLIAIGDSISLESLTILTSENGIKWNAQILAGIKSWLVYRGIAYYDNLFIIMGSNNFLISHDGFNWTEHLLESSLRLNNIICHNGLFVAVGSSILTSHDGIEWTIRKSGFTGLNDVVCHNGLWVAVGDYGSIQTSTDSINWTSYILEDRYNLNAITSHNGLFIAVGNSGTILTSTDGIEWKKQTTGIEGQSLSNLWNATYFNGMYIVIGDHGIILTSTDCLNWTKQSCEITSTLYGITSYNDLLVAVGGYPSIIMTSTDGINWTERDKEGVNNTIKAVISI